MDDDTLDEMVADMICRWAGQRLPAGAVLSRVNLRLIFGTRPLALRVRERLEAASGPSAWYLVRNSSDQDAVKWRNNRPADPPAVVTPATPIVYILFWLPNQPGHERNKESLADLRATAYWQILADSRQLVLPAEEAIAKRCVEAGQAWSKAGAAAEHLQRAWTSVRTCLREERCGPEGSLPFFADLKSYARYLARATVPEEEWQATPPGERAERLVRAWGEALPALGMFRLPELASLLGVTVDPKASVSTKDLTDPWRTKLAEILAGNLDAALDFSKLADKIAGKSTVAEQLDTLAAQVQLCRDDKKRQGEARAALERFCQDGSPEAYERVDWQFRDDPKNRNSRSHGLRGLLIARRSVVRLTPRERVIRDTVVLLVSLLPAESGQEGTLEQYVESQGQAVGRDPAAARRFAEVLRALGSGELPPTSGNSALDQALTLVAHSDKRTPTAFDAVADRWDKLAGDGDDAVVHAPSLLLGLARLCADQLEKSGSGGCLLPGRLPVADERIVLTWVGRRGAAVPPLEFPATRWDEETREQMRQWLRDKVVPALEQGEEEEDEDSDPETASVSELPIEVARRLGGGKGEVLGRVVVDWSPPAAALVKVTGQGLVAWELKTVTEGRGDLRMLSRLFAAENIPRPVNCPEVATEAWQAYRQALGAHDTWAITTLVAPAPSEARGWVEAWSGALDLGQQGTGKSMQELVAEIQKAAAEGRLTDVTALTQQMQARVPSAGPDRPSVDTIRSLLKVCTGAFALNRIVLTSHHPLVLRLRLLGDAVLMDILRRLWTEGWPEAAVEELDDALQGWGWPEPMHFYGWRVGEEPLVFDAWVRDAGFAWFGKAGAGRAAEADSVGATDAAYDLCRYRELFPAAGDRLRLRFLADREGRWARRVLDRVMDAGLQADIDLGTDLPEGEATALEKAWEDDYERQRALEMSDDGTVPRVRLRRCKNGGQEPVHINLVLGDAMRAFAARTLPSPVAPPRLTAWDPGVLFSVPQPELRPNRFLVADPSDELCHRVARAVAYAYNQSLSDVFVEQATFEPDRVREPLARLHDRTHWLILASRQPLHRAVQLAGEEVASLLDFRTASERGRPVYICVSVGTQQFGSDLARLESMLRLLLGAVAEGVGPAFVQAARRFAPRLAMSCAGASTLTEVEGLLGLLLTQLVVRQEDPSAILLALDQHRRLLTGRGRLGDIVRLRLQDGHLLLGVVESKLTRKAVTSPHDAVGEARDQVRATLSRLQHFTTSHPLVPRVRASLARIILDQLHLSEMDPVQAEAVLPFWNAVLQPGTPIEVEPESAAVAHVWSLSADTRDNQLSDGGVRVFIHGRQETLRCFQELLNRP
jgi:hypothetical protein